MKINVFWFRRDLRIDDNTALWQALNSGLPVLPIFIFDTNIIHELSVDDARISFIYKRLSAVDQKFKQLGSSLKIYKSNPIEAFSKLVNDYDVQSVYSNRDYEPYALERDRNIELLMVENGVQFFQFKDQVIFEKDEILKSNQEPYTIYTPYKNQWLKQFTDKLIEIKPIEPLLKNLHQFSVVFPTIDQLGFRISDIKVRDFNLDGLATYSQTRDIPSIDGTSFLGPHLRFGTIGIRQLISQLKESDSVFMSELIWREFFMQIMAHFPRIVAENFKIKYNKINWRNNEAEFEKWCKGQTGYPLVDAGMRQLNETGNMHNRVRMVVASFLCKHLLIDWRWGEAYFANKLIDYELSANNGNWQWAAGCGCDAAPYFRVFNPTEQTKRFDPELKYIRRWVKELDSFDYPESIVEHSFARNRALEVYKRGLNM